MMGVSVPDDSEVVVKNTGAILCFDEKDAVLPEPSACIRCGRCIDACPLNLMPTEIEHAFHAGDADDIRIWHDLRLYDYDRGVPNKALQCGNLQHYIAKYRGTPSPYYTQFYARLAKDCNGKGEYVHRDRCGRYRK